MVDVRIPTHVYLKIRARNHTHAHIYRHPHTDTENAFSPSAPPLFFPHTHTPTHRHRENACARSLTSPSLVILRRRVASAYSAASHSSSAKLAPRTRTCYLRILGVLYSFVNTFGGDGRLFGECFVVDLCVREKCACSGGHVRSFVRSFRSFVPARGAWPRG